MSATKSLTRGKQNKRQRVLIEDESDSEFQTQGFEPQESDGDKLWDVIAIRGERNRKYLIQWAGHDSDGKPWADSWVPREDVTDDLVEAWKREKAERAKRKARNMAGKRQKNRQTSGTPSASRIRTDSKRSTTTASPTTPRRRRRATSISTVGRDGSLSVRVSPVKKKRKQDPVSDHDEGSFTAEDDAPRKKRKLSADRISRRTPPQKRSKTSPRDSDGEEEREEEHSEDRMSARRLSVSRAGSQQEEESDDGETPYVKRANGSSRRTDTGHKPISRLTKPIVHGVEEDEDEENARDTVVRGPAVSRDKERRVEVVLDARVAPRAEYKERSKERTTPPITNGGEQEGGGVLNRGPTPPRRTLAKSSSGHDDRAESVAPPNGVKRGRKRRGPPGVRASEIHVPGSESDATNEAKRSLHSNSSSRSVGSEWTEEASPFKLRQGLTGRMRGRKRPKSGAKKADPRVASVEEERQTKGSSPSESSKRSGSLRKHSAPVEEPLDIADNASLHLIPHGAGATRSFEDNDNQGMFVDPFDELPFSQSVEASNTPGASSHVLVASGTSADAVPGQSQPDDPQTSKGTIVPPTQSQSQSQQESQPQSRDFAQEDLHLASILAERGSDVVDVEAAVDAASPQAPRGVSGTLHPGAGEDLLPISSSIPELESPAASEKVYQRIPIVTPSKFRPYLVQQKPLSALAPPHVTIANRLQDDEMLTSSIESPVKEFDVEDHPTGANGDAGDANPNDTVQPSVGLEDDAIEEDLPRSFELRQRGLELAEIRRKRLRESNETISRIPLKDLLEAVQECSSRAQSEQADASNSSILEGDSKHTMSEVAGEETLRSRDWDDEAELRHFEEEYVDFDGYANLSSFPPYDARPTADTEGRSSMNDVDEDDDNRPSSTTEGDVDEDVGIESSLHEAVDKNDPFISGDLAQRRDVTPTTTTTSQQDDMGLPYTPVGSRFKILGSPSKLESSLVQTPSQQLNEAMGLLHAKSEEVEDLKRRYDESERKRLAQDDALADLEAENAVLKKTLEENGDSSEVVDASTLEQYKEKCEELTKDLDARDAEIRLLKMSRDDATKQAEIFRELYGKASSFADEKKQENDELLERAKRAEGQITIGLDLIRGRYAAQERKLREELEKQQILVSVLTAKDSRTDDEVRRRAALEPELREKIDELKVEIADLEASQSNIVHQRNELLVEKQGLVEELEELKDKYKKTIDDMSWSQIQVARLTAREKAFKKVFLTTSTSAHDDDSERNEERVYICKWMNGYDAKSRCNSLFTSIQDLRDHLFVDHQL